VLLLSVIALFASASTWAHDLNIYQLPYSFHDEQGNRVQLNHWSGHRALITMEYASCQFVCSLAVNKLKLLQHVNELHGNRYEFIVISLDPMHDTPQAWKKYRATRSLHYDNWHYLIPAPRDLPTLAGLFDIKYWSVDDQIMHDFSILYVDETGVGGHSVGNINADLEKFMD